MDYLSTTYARNRLPREHRLKCWFILNCSTLGAATSDSWDWVWQIWFFQPGDCLWGKLHLHRSQCVIELPGLRHADDRRDHTRLLQQPGERRSCRGHSGFSRQRFEGIKHAGIGLADFLAVERMPVSVGLGP